MGSTERSYEGQNNDTGSVRSTGSKNSVGSSHARRKETTIKPSKGLLNKNRNNLMPNIQTREISPYQDST